jgi:hypothetical protein
MHIDEIHDLLSSSNIFRMTKPRRKSWAEDVALTEEIRGAYRVLVGKPEKIRPFGRPWLRGECRVKIDKKCKIGSVD